MVILLLNEQSTRVLTEATFEVGGEARGTAGDTSTGVDATVGSTAQSIAVYDDRRGLFGGAALKGGALAPDEQANLLYYAKALTIKEILFEKKVKPTEIATSLGGKIQEHSRKK